MKTLILISAIVTGFAISANAALAPGYNNLKKMDAAIEAISKGGKGNAPKQPGDVTVARATMSPDKSATPVISVDVGNLICTVELKVIPPPQGMAGASSYKGTVKECNRYMSLVAVEVMKYEDARPALEEAAAQNKVDLSFRVVRTPQGPKVQLTGIKKAL
jgi:hypothetical protein